MRRLKRNDYRSDKAGQKADSNLKIAFVSKTGNYFIWADGVK